MENSRFKFRVWNNATKTMHYPDWKELAVRAELPEVIIMQYTGLLDKQGKEVYEGDVVKCVKGTLVDTPISEVAFSDTGENQRTAGGWVLKSPQSGDYPNIQHFIMGWQSDRYEIIGNIYESPDLLEA